MEERKPKTVSVKRMVEIEKPKTNLRQVKTIGSESKRYSDQVQMDTHLYKLVEAPVIKYLGKDTEDKVHPDSTPQDFVHMGHAHIYRTTDSDGKKHTRCVPIGGHYHVIELDPNTKEGEAPKILAMSGPMRSVAKKIGGRTVMTDEPLNHFDDHVHDVEYLKTEVIQARQSNVEAAKFMAAESFKTPTPPVGMTEGR